MIIPLSFVPGKASPEIQEIFADPVARKLWLLWRRGHIVSQCFNAALWMAVERIKKFQPRDSDGFCLCFPYAQDFSMSDVRRFVEEHLIYLTGEKLVQHLNGCECGSRLSLEILSNGIGDYFVRCPGCGLESDQHSCEWENHAVDRWNNGTLAGRDFEG